VAAGEQQQDRNPGRKKRVPDGMSGPPPLLDLTSPTHRSPPGTRRAYCQSRRAKSNAAAAPAARGAVVCALICAADAISVDGFALVSR
jgi:hypothetical protein